MAIFFDTGFWITGLIETNCHNKATYLINIKIDNFFTKFTDFAPQF